MTLLSSNPITLWEGINMARRKGFRYVAIQNVGGQGVITTNQTNEVKIGGKGADLDGEDKEERIK